MLCQPIKTNLKNPRHCLFNGRIFQQRFLQFSLRRPAGTNTAEPLQPLPLFLPGKSENVRTKPRFPFLNPPMVFGYLTISRLAQAAFLE
jgi:hypothetical protein